MAQLVVRTKGEVKCQHHGKHDLTYECERCPGELCCAVCVSSTHKGHPMHLFEECIPAKIASIELLKEKLEKEHIAENTKHIKTVTAKLEVNKKHYANEIQKTKDDGEKLKKLIDVKTDKIVTDLQKAMTRNDDLLRTALTQLETSQKELKAKSTLQMDVALSGSNVLIYDTETEMQMLTLSEAPTISKLEMCKFVPSEGPEQYVEKVVGKINYPPRQEKEEKEGKQEKEVKQGTKEKEIKKETISNSQLTSRQSGTVFGGKVSIVATRASVMIYDDVHKRWEHSGSSPGLSKVQIYQYTVNNTFRVVGKKVQDHEVVINTAILRGLKYNKATATFHQWRDKRNVYGLNFGSKEEADSFAQTMTKTIYTLNNAGSASKRSYQSV